MQNVYEKESMEGLDLPEKSSVYDFLYHDVNRINSFLSQFHPNGLLQSFTSLDSNFQIRSASATKKLSMKLPAVLQGDTDRNHQNSEINKDESSRTYDPFWQNSLAFLDYLEDIDMISRNIKDAHIGQFVLFTGNLFMFNMGTVQDLIEKTSIKNQALNQAQSKIEKEGMKSAMEIFCILPPSIQTFLTNEDFSVWSTLKREGLSLSTDDLLLKHGPNIAGVWNVIGILDALPALPEEFDISAFPPILQKLNDFLQLAKQNFGRPPDYYGITPLMIFREVSGN